MSDTTSRFASLLPDHSANPIIVGLIGLLIGDAIGVPYEFHSPEDLPDQHQIDMVPPTGFRRAHAGVPPGTWSDAGVVPARACHHVFGWALDVPVQH